LEKGGPPQPGLAANPPPPGPGANPPQGAPGQAGTLPPVQPMPGGDDGSTLGKPPSVLGTLRSGTPIPDQQQAAVAPPPAAPAPVKLPPGSAQSQYNFATDLLHQGDYAGAEQALTQFIAKHPNDPLASSAQYWLGETFFVRKSYDRAAKAFLAGYQKYPKTQKAPDDLLKLAMSLTALNQKKEACAVFRQLSSEYPNADSRIKQSTAREKSRAGCT
ncbi:MAG TPA: tol-pal system protein YbgF, partial [Candidatus Sulfotelmatobacter sp.]|nr:tol-pal system protein YbgF [Candidatus Sulfotelmatobacter sp.]